METSLISSAKVSAVRQPNSENSVDNSMTEVECELDELLSYYKFHPLNFFDLNVLSLVGKTDEFQIYAVYSRELETNYTLKVLNDDSLYTVEKECYETLDGVNSTLKLINSFRFEFPEPGSSDNTRVSSHSLKQGDNQFYFIFEDY